METRIEELEDLYEWLDTYPFSRSKKNLHRDFSDGVLFAEILKMHFPKSVDLHNYSPQNSVANKMENWATLNRKVLKKMGLGLTKQNIENLANASVDDMNMLLLKLKAKIDKMEEKKGSSVSFNSTMGSQQGTDIFNVPIKITNNDSDQAVIYKEQKMVSVDLFKMKLQEIDLKNETIEILNQKLTHLENLLKIKDERIDDLIQQLQKYQSLGKTSIISALANVVQKKSS